MMTVKEIENESEGKGKGMDQVGMEEVARGEEFIAAGVSEDLFRSENNVCGSSRR